MNVETISHAWKTAVWFFFAKRNSRKRNLPIQNWESWFLYVFMPLELPWIATLQRYFPFNFTGVGSDASMPTSDHTTKASKWWGDRVTLHVRFFIKKDTLWHFMMKRFWMSRCQHFTDSYWSQWLGWRCWNPKSHKLLRLGNRELRDWPFQIWSILFQQSYGTICAKVAHVAIEEDPSISKRIEGAFPLWLFPWSQWTMMSWFCGSL